MSRSKSVGVRLDDDTMARLTKAAQSRFEKPATLAAEMLCKMLKKDLPPEAIESSPYVQMKEKKLKIETDSAEFEFERRRKQFVHLDLLESFLGEKYGNIASVLKSLPYSVPTFTPEQSAELGKTIQDVFTELSASTPPRLVEMAKATAEEK